MTPSGLPARIGALTLFIDDVARSKAFYRRVFPKAGGRRLETFYRAARKTTGLLMDGAEPIGGAWNYDAENRKPWKGTPPAPRVAPPVPREWTVTAGVPPIPDPPRERRPAHGHGKLGGKHTLLAGKMQIGGI